MLTDFYTIKKRIAFQEKHEVVLQLNPQSSIFKGHFPAQPILPGVLLLQLFQLEASEAIGISLRIKQVKQLKFIASIQPDSSKNLRLLFSIDAIEEPRLTGKVYYEKELSAKVNIIFKKV